MRDFDEDSDPEVEDVLVDLYEDIGGARVKGTKNVKEFLKFCKAM